MEKMFKILNFLRITDDSNRLSITNITVMLMMYKIISTPALSMQDIAIAIVPLFNYAYKKKLESGQE